MRYLLSILLLVGCIKVHGQNLCPNGNFEQITSCPASGSVSFCTGWYNYTLGSTDAYNTCSTGGANVPNAFRGPQYAASGNGYIGFLTKTMPVDYKEYAARQIAPLIPGAVYEVSLSMNLSDYSGWGTDDVGVYFFDNGPTTIFNTAYVIPVTPQIDYSKYGVILDTVNWIRVTDTFQADSAYDNMVIGGFKDANHMMATQISGSSSYYANYYVDSVVMLRVPNLKISLADTALCPGDSINVAYDLPTGYQFIPSNVFTLQLSNAAGSFSSPVTLGSFTASVPGTFKGYIPAATAPGTGYKLRIIASLPTDTSASYVKNIIIKPIPVPVASANTPVCTGSTLLLSATALSGSSYSWTGPGSFSSNQQNPSVSNMSSAAVGNYIVMATLAGCTAKDTVAVSVIQSPATPVANNNGPVCPGDSVSLTALSTTNGVSYSWTGPASFNSNQQNPTLYNVSAGNGGIYSATATLNGCTSAAGTTIVIVKPLPATPTAGSNSPICAGGILNLTAASTTGANYTWTGPNNFTSNLQNPSISPVSMNDAGTYSVTAELNGCISTGSGSTTVVVNNVSSLGIYPSPNDTLCINSSNATFVAVPFNAGTSPQYQWYKNNNPVTGAMNITYPATGIMDMDSFYCRMTVTGLCADPLILYSNKIGMTVLPMTSGPAISISADPGTTLSPWQLVKFTATVTNAGSNPQYQWKRNGHDVVGAIYYNWSAYNLSDGDTISCVVTSALWCASPAGAESNRLLVHIKTGVEEVDKDNDIALYPNPNDGRFSLSLPPTPSQGGRNVFVEVVNAVGQIVFMKNIPLAPFKGGINVSLPEDIVSGVYLLRVRMEDRVKVLRFTVNR